LFDVGYGFDTPENESKLSFYTASTPSSHTHLVIVYLEAIVGINNLLLRFASL
jgi:hypothetical protein